MSKREFLQLCHTYNPDKHHINRWYMSEKLDGMRCFWDGGLTTGMALSQIPWANTEKDARYITRPKASGLWSRYGKAIQAPDYWLEQLPKGIPLDGELYAGYNSFQYITSTVKDLVPGPGWNNIKYHVFDSPAYSEIFSSGTLSFGHSKVKHDFQDCLKFVIERVNQLPLAFKPLDWFMCQKAYESTYWKLHELDIENKTLLIHPQKRLPVTSDRAHNDLKDFCDHIISLGGEGIVIRNYNTPWEPRRSYNCLKHKPYLDDEATVIGYVWGKETDLGSKLLGLMGALIVEWKGHQFELSGFTEEERVMEIIQPVRIPLATANEAMMIGRKYPGQKIEENIYNYNFPRNSQVTFRYSGRLTDDGKPKEARYHRKKSDD